MEVTDAGSTEIVNETVEPTTEAVTVETEDAGTAQQESTGTVAEVDSSADTKDTGKDNQSDNIASEEKLLRIRSRKKIKALIVRNLRNSQKTQRANQLRSSSRNQRKIQNRKKSRSQNRSHRQSLTARTGW